MVTAVDDDPINSIPADFELYQNYPNPFNPKTAIRYQLAVAGQVELAIFNTLGQKVATLVNEQQPAGFFEVTFDASGLAGGIYFYQLKTDRGFIQTKKLLLLK